MSGPRDICRRQAGGVRAMDEIKFRSHPTFAIDHLGVHFAMEGTDHRAWLLLGSVFFEMSDTDLGSIKAFSQSNNHLTVWARMGQPLSPKAKAMLDARWQIFVGKNATITFREDN